MREILFRGKEKGSKKWLYGDLMQCSFIDRRAFQIFPQTSIAEMSKYLDEATIGQYTGLTDRDGTKIFEGDFVQTSKYGKDSGDGCNFAGKDIFLICFEDGGYCLRSNWRRFNLRPDTDYKVIGNIHDNRELSEGVMP